MSRFQNFKFAADTILPESALGLVKQFRVKQSQMLFALLALAVWQSNFDASTLHAFCVTPIVIPDPSIRFSLIHVARLNIFGESIDLWTECNCAQAGILRRPRPICSGAQGVQRERAAEGFIRESIACHMVTTNSEVFAGAFASVLRSYVCPQCDKSLANVPGLFKPALVAAHLSRVVWVLDFLIVYSFVSKFPSSLFFCLFADEIYTPIHANTHPPIHTH